MLTKICVNIFLTKNYDEKLFFTYLLVCRFQSTNKFRSYSRRDTPQ
jgi:hypothetical protein